VAEPIHLSNRTARRFILAKQGLWPGRRGTALRGTRAAMIACEHIQLDPLVIVARSHDLMLHARVNDYRPELFHQLVYEKREFFDWGGWLAVRPMSELPYWRVIMRRNRALPRMRAILEHHGATIEAMRLALHERGTVSSRDFAAADTRAVVSYRGTKDTSLALYYLWRTGEAMTHHREGFERVYGLAEDIAPAHLLAEADEAEADRFVLRKQVAFAGIGRLGPLGILLHRPIARGEEATFARGMVETGELAPVEVEGWPGRFFVLGSDLGALAAVDADRVPRSWKPIGATTADEVALLSPLDPVIERARAKAVFGFEYVWEIYKRADQVQYGRFTMPILWEDRLVGRIDLKADRRPGVLVVNGIWLERAADARSKRFRDALRAGMRHLMRFLELERFDAAAVDDTRLRRSL
jgi:uncharacterized protein YcaQ